jgi:hypothetical protein
VYSPVFYQPFVVILQIKRFARCAQFSHIVKQGDDDTTLFGYFRGQKFPEAQKGFCYPDAVFQKTLVLREMIPGACRRGEPGGFSLQERKEAIESLPALRDLLFQSVIKIMQFNYLVRPEKCGL